MRVSILGLFVGFLSAAGVFGEEVPRNVIQQIIERGKDFCYQGINPLTKDAKFSLRVGTELYHSIAEKIVEARKVISTDDLESLKAEISGAFLEKCLFVFEGQNQADSKCSIVNKVYSSTWSLEILALSIKADQASSARR